MKNIPIQVGDLVHCSESGFIPTRLYRVVEIRYVPGTETADDYKVEWIHQKTLAPLKSKRHGWCFPFAIKLSDKTNIGDRKYDSIIAKIKYLDERYAKR